MANAPANPAMAVAGKVCFKSLGKSLGIINNFRHDFEVQKI